MNLQELASKFDNPSTPFLRRRKASILSVFETVVGSAKDYLFPRPTTQEKIIQEADEIFQEGLAKFQCNKHE